MKPLVCAMLLASVAGCATPRAERLSSITVIQRPTYAVCGGYCPNRKVTVREDGRVGSDLQVTREQAAQFFRTLDRYRPNAREGGPETCAFWKTNDPMVLKVYPMQIIWTDAEGRIFRLRSCGDPGLGEVMRQAFWSIGL